MYSQFNPQDVDLLRWTRCSDCPAVDLLPENRDAWDLYSRCWNQVVTIGMGEVIGLNVLAVDRVMEMMGVPQDRRIDLYDQAVSVHDTIFPMEKKKPQIQVGPDGILRTTVKEKTDGRIQ